MDGRELPVRQVETIIRRGESWKKWYIERGIAREIISLLSHSQFRSLPSALSLPQSNLPQYHGTTTPSLQRPSLRLHPLVHHASPVSTFPPSDLALKFEISRDGSGMTCFLLFSFDNLIFDTLILDS
ncbi:hypothetical protein LguiA_005473 [Lonicera macranthoides]